MPPISRRDFLSAGAVLLGSGFSLDCIGSGEEAAPTTNDGRLTARPGVVTGSVRTGTTPLNLGGARDGLLFVPSSYTAGTPAPLIVLLHGAGGSGLGVFQRFSTAAEASGAVVVAPDSTASTWDIAFGGFGADVKYIDRVLKDLFPRVAVDPARIAIAGFSDGASYALSLGLTNGDLFTRVAAFSPGFFLPGGLHGKPPVYISHGIGDTILPINSTSRRLVPQLTRAGYAVRYHEFDGPHTVPPAIADEGIRWIAGDAAAP
jgi:phospholipase/carboxylesterase